MQSRYPMDQAVRLADLEIFVRAFNAHETPAAFTTPVQATAAVEDVDAITAIVVPGDDGNGAGAHGGLVGLGRPMKVQLSLAANFVAGYPTAPAGRSVTTGRLVFVDNPSSSDSTPASPTICTPIRHYNFGYNKSRGKVIGPADFL